MLSNAQNRLYFRAWAAVRRTCKDHGWPEPDRHDLHFQALGVDKSHLDFTNSDLDKTLAAFRACSAPEDLAAQLRAQDQPRIRLLYSISRLAPEAYTAAIAADKFGTADLDRLDLAQLHQLRMTLAARAGSRARRQAAA